MISFVRDRQRVEALAVSSLDEPLRGLRGFSAGARSLVGRDQRPDGFGDTRVKLVKTGNARRTPAAFSPDLPSPDLLGVLRRRYQRARSSVLRIPLGETAQPFRPCSEPTGMTPGVF